jgi:hypothetical protein
MPVDEPSAWRSVYKDGKFQPSEPADFEAFGVAFDFLENLEKKNGGGRLAQLLALEAEVKKYESELRAHGFVALLSKLRR